MTEPRWRLAPLPPLREVLGLARELGLPVEAALLYAQRGIRRREDLEAPLGFLPLKGLEEAARVLEEAIRRGKRIRVHGDYDADGLTGTALLVRGLRALGARVEAFIPHRLKEGYGVSAARLEEHKEADLFLTVDCGISNHAELRELVENGVEVLVSDHHTPGESLPPGRVVHPALGLEDGTPLKGPKPTGAGVAFLLLWALHQRLGLPPPLEYADLAAVGTIADVAPLWGWNRALVREGLARLGASATLGLRVLAERVGYGGKAWDVAFRIAPRLNAPGRLGEAEKALRLLLTEDLFEAQALAEELDRLNARRQAIEEEMLARLLPQVDPSRPALLLHDPEGHPGVMGLVASRLLQLTFRPVFIMAQGKGSVRSLPPISAVEALRQARAHLLHFGGHRGAAGFALREEDWPAFARAVEAYVVSLPRPDPVLEVASLLPAPRLLPGLYRALEGLEPFGEGNPGPLFLLAGTPEEVRRLGDDRHLAFFLGRVRVLLWGRKGAEASLPPGPIEAAVALRASEWNGELRYEAVAEAVRPLGGSWAEGEGWAWPLPLAQALAQAKGGEGVYIPEANGRGLAYARAQGFRLLPPEEASLWLGLPPGPVRPKEGQVGVALGPEARRALEEEAQAGEKGEGPKERLLALVLRRLLWAYERGLKGVFTEALVAYWALKAEVEDVGAGSL